MTAIFEHHVIFDQALDDETETAFAFLCHTLEKANHKLSNATLKQAISKGALWLTRGKSTQRLRRIKKTLLQNDELHFYYNETVLSNQVLDATLISDEIDYSVWYKPFGMLSQGSKWSDHCTLARFAQQQLMPERSVFIVHRLDKAATGLMLLAHSKKAARALAAMFENRTLRDQAPANLLENTLENTVENTQESMLDKHYQIIVHGDHSKNEQPQIITHEVDGKKAQSTFMCLDYNEQSDQSLIDVKIDSGRKHQIRIHAASIGLPIVGDRLHGIADENETQDLQLCAVSLSFICPMKGDKKQFNLANHLKPQL